MGVLRSDLFKDDSKLEECANIPLKHLKVGTTPGAHIAKIHAALERLRPSGPVISADEKRSMAYGSSTAAAVLNYKAFHVPPIINFSYQKRPDNIVGRMTIRAMDEELFGAPAPTPAFRNAIADRAFTESRASLQVAITHLRALRNDINGLPNSADPAFGNAMLKLLTKHSSSRSDVTVTVTKLDSRTVNVTSDYGRLGAVVIPLTRIDDKVLNADGDTPLILDLGQQPPRLDYSPHNEVSYAGYKQ
ncbi:MAG: hypothetical protein V2J55_10175 [Candidatus Competibacteraceae bacterium]|jgi:hypothetical protein|nr:hypothetical protein [Candidatus Competibacteraceae bacterium]